MKFNPYLSKFVVAGAIIIICLRTWEFLTYGIKYSFGTPLIQGEAWGLCHDFLLWGAMSLVFWTIQSLWERQWMRIFFTFLLLIFTVFHLGFVHYFNYQQGLLDVFVYQYPWNEVEYTIATTESNNSQVYKGVFVFILLIISIFYIVKKINFNEKWQRAFKIYSLVSLPLFLFFSSFKDANDFLRNKSTHFYSKSFAYFLNIGSENQPYTLTDAKAFGELYNENKYTNPEFPLLHRLDTTDYLGNYLAPMSAPPNIVLLIIEGLNDDYIHDNQGLTLMPFVKSLAEKSLYWDHAFTLGERSFAAVPCFTGGLPYGKKGFNFLDKIPYHHSLTSVLETNGFQTNFFAGQGAWFHNKDRFFKQNNVDLIIDNSNFAEKYRKIIVKDFFWGYDDKDIYNQSLEILDTLPKTKRFDVYFSGSMHSPFSISDDDFYSNKWSKLIENQSLKDKKHYTENALLYKTIVFADDALKDFFEKYQQRPNYENTIFIVTGDHPMTELPRSNSLKRYHVPMIIFSPKLKAAKVFSERVSQLDAYETLVAYLHAQHQIKAPTWSAALGTNFLAPHQQNRPFAFMNDNREIVDFLHGDYYIADDILYQVDKNLLLTPIQNRSIKKAMQAKLATFKKTNYYTTLNDKIMPDSLCMADLGYQKKNIVLEKTIGKCEDEFLNLKTQIPVNQQDKIVEVIINHSFIPFDGCVLVCEIKDATGKIVAYQQEKIKPNTSFTQAHFKIPSIKNATLMNLYIWNIKKQAFEFKNLNVSLFSK